VYSTETDYSDVINSIATTSAGIAFYSTKGSTTGIMLMTNTQQFIAEYGEPVLGNPGHYSALAYLQNGKQLYCYRVQSGALYGGVDIKTAISAQANAAISVGVATPDFVLTSGQDNLFQIYGANPGTWNNNIGIRFANINTGPNLNDYAFDIQVYYYADGAYTQVESWTVSRKHQLDGYGRQQYLETVINGFSSYIVVADSTYSDDTLPKAQATTLALAEGSNGTDLISNFSAAPFISGWDEFENPDVVDIRVLINAGQTDTSVQAEIIDIAEARKDCIAIIDMDSAQTTSVTSMVNWRNNTLNENSSYAALYAPMVKDYDSYNDTIVYLPGSGYIASQFAYNDYIADVWYAPAGLNRGILNVLSICDQNGDRLVFTEGERDSLYVAQINPLQVFSGSGNVIWGQKTLTTKSSALDRVNVRRLLIILEKTMSVSLRQFVFEPNSEFTRFRITAMLDTYLDLLSAKGAFQTELGDKGYLVVCDTTNNTPATIDRNELHVDVYVKPSRAAEFIHLNTIVTTTGVQFSELIAQGNIL
jgi:hypothetical protein